MYHFSDHVPDLCRPSLLTRRRNCCHGSSRSRRSGSQRTASTVWSSGKGGHLSPDNASISQLSFCLRCSHPVTKSQSPTPQLNTLLQFGSGCSSFCQQLIVLMLVFCIYLTRFGHLYASSLLRGQRALRGQQQLLQQQQQQQQQAGQPKWTFNSRQAVTVGGAPIAPAGTNLPHYHNALNAAYAAQPAMFEVSIL